MPGIKPGMTMRDAVFDFIAMAGLVPAIHVFEPCARSQDVDAMTRYNLPATGLRGGT